MKEFRALTMVNWWLFEEPKVIEMRGHALLSGANASGKSSILDGIQVVMLGGDGRKMRFNQRADEKSKRDLKSYCLGIATMDPEEGAREADLEPRKSALTHLAMTWEGDDGAFYNAGLLLSTRDSDSKPDTELLYLIQGPRLRSEDFIATDSALDKAGMQASLEAIHNRALREMPHRYPSLVFCKNATDYQERLAAMLSGTGGIISAERLIRAFVGALQFRPDNNIDSFVRNQILPPMPMNLDDMRRAIRDYRIIKEKIKETIQRLGSLNAIAKQFADASEKERLRDQYNWVAAEASCLAYQDLLADLEDDLEKVAERARKAEVDLHKAESELETTKQRRQQLEVARAAQAPDQQVQVFDAQLRAAEKAEAVASGQVREGIDLWRTMKSYLSTTPIAPVELTNALARLSGHAQHFGDGGLPTDHEINAALNTAIDQAGKWAKELEGEIYKQNRAREDAELREADLSSRIDEVQGGKVELPRDVQQLMLALHQRNIEAIPVCMLVEVTDEEWRDALESHLGAQRYSLIVQPGQLDEATRVYKAVRKTQGIFGTRIFQSKRADEFLTRPPVLNSVASKLKSDQKLAQAWIRRALGGIEIAEVDSDTNTRSKNRSLTIEGRYYDGTYITYPRPAVPALGKGAAALRLPKLREELDQAVRDAKRAIGALTQLKGSQTFLNENLPLLKSRREVGKAMRESIENRNSATALRRTIESSVSPELRKLNSDIEALDGQIKAQGTVVSTRRNTVTDTAEKRRGAENEQQKAASKCSEMADKRTIAQAVPGLDQAAASVLLQKLQEKHAAETMENLGKEFSVNVAVSAAANLRALEVNNLAIRYRQTAATALGEHRVTYKVEGLPSTAGVLEQETWVLAEINRVKETELDQYEKQSELAERTVSSTIRGDFSGHLIHARKQMRNVFNERNALLETREFSGGEKYHFKPTMRPEFKPILDWLDEIEMQDQQRKDDTEGRRALFGDAKFKEAQDKVMAVLGEAGDIPPEKLAITDYRAYYSFDMLVTKPNGTTYSVQKRLAHGSGGERYTPLYMAVGSAISGAYRITMAPDNTHLAGASLTLLDEAFNNLDIDNIDSCMGVLQSFGLQLIIACPDEKAPTLRPYADTHIEMIKDGGTVIVKTRTLKAKGKELFRNNFPLELKIQSAPATTPSLQAA